MRPSQREDGMTIGAPDRPSREMAKSDDKLFQVVDHLIEQGFSLKQIAAGMRIYSRSRANHYLRLNNTQVADLMMENVQALSNIKLNF